jgi:large subunit ribosomal protein L25
MAQITINAQVRTALGRQVNNLRKSGKLPAVLYGHNTGTQSLEINEREFAKVFKLAGESTILSLNVDGKAFPVLVHDVQHHYLNDQPIHVDFYAVNMTEKLTASIPFHFIGEAPAVKAMGGILVKNLSEVEVECLPADLPHAIEIDLSSLNTFEDAIHISDIKISDKVTIKAAPEETIVNVAPPRSEEELKTLDEQVEAPKVEDVEGVVKPTDTPAAEGEAAPAEAKEKKE